MRKLSLVAVRAVASIAVPSFAWLAACGSSTPPPAPAPKAIGSASIASTLPTTTASTSTSAPLTPLDALRARGPLVGEPLRIAGKSQAGRVVAFIGSGEATVAAWSMADADAAFGPEPRWPVGVKVTGAFASDGDVPYALVQSLAVLDQPAGLHGVIPIDAHDDYDDLGRDDDLVAFQGVTTIDAAKAIASAPQQDRTPLVAAMKGASSSAAALKKAASKDGIDLYESYQGTFLVSAQHLDAAAIATSPRADAMRALLADAASAGSCGRFVCDATDTDTGASIGHVVLAHEGERWVVRGFFLPKEPIAAKPASATASLMPSAKASAATNEVLQRHLKAEGSVIEASLGGSGTLALVAPASNDEGPALMIHQGILEAVIPLSDFGYVSSAAGSATYDARFADVNGDGTTDVIVQMSATGEAATTYRQVHLTPTTLRGSGLLSPLDPDRQLEVFLAASLDDAAKSAMAHVSASFTHKEACALLAPSKTLAGVRSIALPDASVVTFTEPGMATFRATSKRLDALAKDEWYESAFDCKGYRCDGDSYCVTFDGPGSTHWWLRRVGKQLKVLGVAVYGGD